MRCVLFSAAIYIILTIPHWLLFFFDWGFEYSFTAIIVCALISGIGGIIIDNRLKKKC
jgi:hypothetical protein